MNRHKNNWSQMHDEQKEQSQLSKDYEDFIKAVKIFSGKYGKEEAATIIRKVYMDEI